jgi:hypothetical protein
MKEELEKELVKKYPKLYAQVGGSPYKTCMADGITCGSGWYDLIDRLSARLETFNGVEAAQVKEKFGALRFYLDHTLPLNEEQKKEIFKIVGEAEEESGRTCEDCGKPAKLRSIDYWLCTLCEDCLGAAIERRRARLEKFMDDAKTIVKTHDKETDEWT